MPSRARRRVPGRPPGTRGDDRRSGAHRRGRGGVPARRPRVAGAALVGAAGPGRGAPHPRRGGPARAVRQPDRDRHPDLLDPGRGRPRAAPPARRGRDRGRADRHPHRRRGHAPVLRLARPAPQPEGALPQPGRRSPPPGRRGGRVRLPRPRRGAGPGGRRRGPEPGPAVAGPAGRARGELAVLAGGGHRVRELADRAVAALAAGRDAGGRSPTGPPTTRWSSSSSRRAGYASRPSCTSTSARPSATTPSSSGSPTSRPTWTRRSCWPGCAGRWP